MSRVFTWHAVGMTLGGTDLREARELAGYPGKAGRAAFADLAGVSPRTVEGWEARGGRVPEHKEKLVRKILTREGDPLEQVSNMDLIAQLIKRLAAYEEMERRLRDLTDSDNASVTDVRSVNEVNDESGTNSLGQQGNPQATWGTGPLHRGEYNDVQGTQDD